MKYYSTRDTARNASWSLTEAAFMGLAPDGGLFMPEYVPQADLAEVQRLASISYADMAIYLASLFFGDDVPAGALESMVRSAYDFDCPLVELASGIDVLELFHGPTFAFKDFGARFMGGMLGLLNKSDKDLTVLTATSGDTGSAVAAGFHNVPGVRVIVLYPRGQVSPLQEAQMTTLGGNITPVSVNGCFDDCQALVKAVFNDREFRKTHNVTSANSINVLRWIPQSFYYFYAWAQWVAKERKGSPDIVVPSGNYGNITAGMLAARMGLPVRRFVCGANANDVIPEFLSTGVYRPRASVRTVANAMDVGAPSNYERLMCLYDSDYQKIVSSLQGFAYSDDQIREAIREIYGKYAYVSDPHAAVAYMAYRDSSAEGFYLATAHPAKFPDVISDAFASTDVDAREIINFPEGLSKAMKKEKSFILMENDLEALEALI